MSQTQTNYETFLASLSTGDNVKLYDTKYGDIVRASITDITPDGQFVFEALGSFSCNERGNGMGYARSMKMFPANIAMPMAEDRIFTNSEIEEII